ncbi:hypothetical protein F4604DRAFT_2009498, partial [Suillus subluteus]
QRPTAISHVVSIGFTSPVSPSRYIPFTAIFSSALTTMASACTYHGIVGVQNATRYILDPKKTFWMMEGFVPVSPDPEDGIGDLPASIFIFGGRNAPPEDGIYFVNARIVTTTVNESTSLELYCVDSFIVSIFNWSGGKGKKSKRAAHGDSE